VSAPGNGRIFECRSRRLRRLARDVLGALPPLEGREIEVSVRPRLRVFRGVLISGAGFGEEVYAGSLMPARHMEVDSSLLDSPAEFARIFIHEIFHFVWLRAGNQRRRSYELVLESEWRSRARGELGWSAERRKRMLAPGDIRQRTRKWREYACESFCDTAAWAFSPVARHSEFTLKGRFRTARRAWLDAFLARPVLPL
jgi:hypothetical protein